MKKLTICIVTIIILVNCSEDSPSPQPSSYLLITDQNCTIRNFDFSSQAVTDNQSCIEFRYWDFVNSGNIGYGVRYNLTSPNVGVSLVKLDLSNQSIVKSSEPDVNWFDFTRLELFNDQLIYVYSTFTNSFKLESKIEFYNQNLEKDAKSIQITAIDPAAQLYLTATKVFENKLFIGYRENSNYGTLVYDLSSKSLIKKIDVGSTEFLPLNGSQILCLSPSALTIINTQTLEVKKSVASGVKRAPSVSNVSAFDSKNNIVFILFEAAQPSRVAYYLSSFDPVSGILKIVNPSSANLIYPPLVYDATSNFLLSGTGTGNSLAIFSSAETDFSAIALNDKLMKIELKK